MKLFNLDSPLMQALNKVADLLWLNMLTLILCLPIVTAGASLTAMNYMALKIVRNEECYITRGFFKSFKENFRQATLIWLIIVVLFVILAADFLVMRGGGDTTFGMIMWVGVAAAAILLTMTVTFVFPVLARFENTIFRTIKNAFMISLMQFPKTILIIAAYFAPVILFFLFPQIMPLCIMFGLSLPAWLAAKLYNKFFKKLENRVMAENPPQEMNDGAEDERIFRDELDPVLSDKNVTQ